MKKLLLLSSLALALISVSTQAQTSTKKVYGTSFTTANAISPARLSVEMKDKDKLEDIQLTGYISKVCQREGCWMVISSDKNGSDDVMVRMKDHSFAVPKDIAGKTATVKGSIVKKMQSVAEQKHYLQDEGAAPEVIAKITTPKPVYEMQVTGVYLD
jgi:hypothetical protein